MILHIRRERGDDNKYQCSKRKHREMRLYMLFKRSHIIFIILLF